MNLFNLFKFPPRPANWDWKENSFNVAWDDRKEDEDEPTTPRKTETASTSTIQSSPTGIEFSSKFLTKSANKTVEPIGNGQITEESIQESKEEANESEKYSDPLQVCQSKLFLAHLLGR